MPQNAITNIRNSSFANRHSSLSLLFLLILFIVISACDNKNQTKEPSLPTKGEVVIAIDESLKSFVDAEISMFSIFYPESRITPLYLPEKEVVEKLLANEIQTGIICRNFLKEEADIIEDNYSHKITTCKIGYERIAVVVNKKNPLEEISYIDINRILSGKISTWNQLDRSFNTESPVITVIPKLSSIDRLFFSSDEMSSHPQVHALGTTTEILDYVGKNISAIGIVGGSSVYTIETQPSNIRVLKYIKEDLKNKSQAEHLLFEVYAVTHEPFTGLGNGFISFLVSQKGQLILSKSGLIPCKPIEREIKISDSL